MRRQNGILIFDNWKEEKEEIENGFQGIFITRHPYVLPSCDILEIFHGGNKKTIGEISTYNFYEGRYLKNEVIKILTEKSPASLEMGIPEIAISAKLKAIYNI